MRTRWSAYAGVSTALAGGVIIKALAQRPNFYSASVYLSQSSANLLILTNFIFVTACTLLLGLQKLLYGPLRPIEVEQLYEKAWFAVTETCLAMTIFRGEIGAWFLVMFFALLAGKVWAWIGEGRVEILEQQPPRNPRLFHTRLALSLGLSVIFDLTMLEYVVKQVMHMARPDMMVMFGFEFAVLSIVSLSTASRYAINLMEIAIIRKQKTRRIDEIRRERIATAVMGVEQSAQQNNDQSTSGRTESSTPNPTVVPLQAVEAARRALQQPIDEQEIEVEGWEGKGRWIFYLDLATDFFKLVVYLSFFFILLIFYGLPIHILRDVFMTFRSFFKRIGDFLRYRTATRDMNARYPDATEQDIGSEDVCIICREEMRPYQPPANGERIDPVAERMRPKKLPCGHILHFSCLRSWLERQQICPTCRTNVVTRSTTRTGQNAGGADGAAGQHGNAGAPERQGPRVYQWGPLRIGIGAARGNMLEDLQQQLGDGQPRQAQQAHGDGPQQYGFGIRWDGLRRRDRGERGQRSIQRQLDDVQRQINQEYRALGQMTNEMRVLRNMEAELTRIRAQRQGGTVPARAASQLGNASLPTVTALAGNPQQAIPAGSDQLPAGVALPEGWSLMPLHPAQLGTQTMPGQHFHNLPNQVPFPPFGVGHFQPDPQHHPQPSTLQTQLLGQNGQQLNAVPPTTTNGINMPSPVVPQQGMANNNRSEQSVANTTRRTPAGQTNHLAENSQVQTDTNATSGSTYRPQNTAAAAGTQSTGTISQIATPRNHQQSNGAATADVNRSVQSPAYSTGEAPVASMFTLPTWGSVPMATSTSNRARREPSEPDAERDRSNASSWSDIGSSNQGQATAPSGTASRSKNPTVEDLAEDPD